MLTGNEINPIGEGQVLATIVLTILGSLLTANIFGAFAVIVSNLNRKNSKFQEKIDTANSSMVNMKIPEELQDEVRQFMVATQDNLDNQKELDSFMQMISPSLRIKVTKYIFFDAIASNDIFKYAGSDLVDFIISDITT